MTLTVANPFTDAACRQSAALARWWDDDARHDERTLAARLCATCPALDACRTVANELGPAATGTWAGTYQPYTGNSGPSADTDALNEYLHLFGPNTPDPTLTPHPTQPTRRGRYWLHPAQLTLEWQDT